MFDVRTYMPAGPVIKRFHESNAFFRPLAGPIGSGKTTAAYVAEPIFTAMCQLPEEDGVRRAKVGILRDTYRNLYATTMKSWLQWIPKELGRYVGSDDRPAEHQFTLETPYGPCEVIAEFRALGANSVENVTRGWELSAAGMDEADLMPHEAITFLAGRVMRYGKRNSRRTRGVWFTFNKPDVDHPLYNLCMEDGLKVEEELAAEIGKQGMKMFEFFDQPGGLLDGLPLRTNPDAENLANLDPAYYLIAAAGQREGYVTRMIRNRWGSSMAGDVIYPEFRRERHVSRVELEPAPGTTLRIGLDGGGTPAAVIMGRDRFGRRVIYAEVVITTEDGKHLRTGSGPKRLAQAIRDALWPRFRGCNIEMGYGDPAAFYGADREAGEMSFMETVSQHLNIPILPTDSNEIGLRLEAVRGLVSESAEDGLPLLLINPSCRWVIRGFTSDYKWEVLDPKQPGKNLKPQKTVTSHVHDALQYICLGDVGRVGVTGGRSFDRWQPKGGPGGLMIPVAPGIDRPWEGPMRTTVAGSNYSIDFDPWKS
jgi:hypothetical protein